MKSTPSTRRIPVTNGAVFSFGNRAGNKIPVSRGMNSRRGSVTTRNVGPILRDWARSSSFNGRISFYMDNANLLKAPGYELVNLNVHYKTDLITGLLPNLELYVEVRNVFDRTYIASANNIANTVTSGGVQNPANILANTTGSIYAGLAAGLCCRHEDRRSNDRRIRRGRRKAVSEKVCLRLSPSPCAKPRCLGADEPSARSGSGVRTDRRFAAASKVTPTFGLTARCGWSGWRERAGLRCKFREFGRSFSAPTLVTRERLNLDWGPYARPKIVVDGKGVIALAFSIFRDKAFNGQVLYTRSTDGGRSFAEPRPITSTGT